MHKTVRSKSWPILFLKNVKFYSIHNNTCCIQKKFNIARQHCFSASWVSNRANLYYKLEVLGHFSLYTK